VSEDEGSQNTIDTSPPSRGTTMGPPVHLKGIPRRSRILAVALFCVCLFLLVSKFDVGFTGPRLLSFGASKPKYDILKYVDPLIGTTNGGESLIFHVCQSEK
jgi:hypothetical protein